MASKSGQPGTCAMRDSCGRKGFFGKELPCPYDGPPVEPENSRARKLLVDVCGTEFAEGPTCCTTDQLDTLRENFQQVDGIISPCPACRNNFRSFFCKFTCSPDQGTFVNVTSTQVTSSNQVAVQSVDFFASQEFGEGFFDSCKNVQMGAANTYAMDLIGGGAKNYTSFFKFLGDEKPIGSPFQIDFPTFAPEGFSPLDTTPRHCADNDLQSRCSCVDCPSVCPALPSVDPPNAAPTCNIGAVSCLTFALILTYSVALFGFLLGLIVEKTIRNRREKGYERVALSADANSISSPRNATRNLVGAGSLAHHPEDESTRTGSSDTRGVLGRGASLIDPVESAQPRNYRLNSYLRRGFYRIGCWAAEQPYLNFAVIFLAYGLLNIGWKNFAVEKDPVRLWVGSSSESKVQKEFFDQNFGPFYRPQQIFVTSAPHQGTLKTISNDSETYGVLSWDHLRYWAKVEADIRSLQSSPNGYTLHDVCFKPSGSRGPCVVQSPMAWYGNDLDDYDEESWAGHLKDCAKTPVECLPDFQQPLSPQYVLGGVPEDSDGQPQYLDAEAMVVTYVVSDSLDQEVQDKALEWERALREYLQDLSIRAPTEAGLDIGFSAGVSLEEEINKSTNTDVKIVVLSYVAMFIYISLTLGRGSGENGEEGVSSSFIRWLRNFPRLFRRSNVTSSAVLVDPHNAPTLLPQLPRSLFIGSKFTLGLFGISLVILSVATSVGFFSACGVKVTLIIAEVIPFLVLAVGVDNVFILVHELDRQNMLHGPNAIPPPLDAAPPMSPTNSHRSPFDDLDLNVYLTPEERIARTMAKMGPSILLSTMTETVAFALGALVPMPAVRNFALYAAGSVLLNAILQITVFTSALYLDLRRVEAHRVDCFPCIRIPTRIALPSSPNVRNMGGMARFIRRHYAPFLLKPVVKGVVILTFAGIFVLSVISMQHIQLGLDQRLALPSDSYLVNYFNKMDQYLNVGPPVYFVAHNLDVTKREGQQAICGRFTTCEEFSMANILEQERNRKELSFISEPSASWIDDFFGWLDPEKDDCCRVRKDDPSVFCKERSGSRLCKPCYQGKNPSWNITMKGLPEDEEFMRYLRQWLVSPTTETCPMAGKASFGTALSLDDQENNVSAFHFRTFHKPLKNQQDFIDSFTAAHRVADDIGAQIGADVFPYSLHYVFFDQYAHIIAVTEEVLGLGLLSVLIVTALLLGSWRTALIVTGTVALTVTTVMGVMAVWGISLNAISLVNLVISLGIAVEFCAHIARAYMSSGSGLPVDHPGGQREKDERMFSALVDVGPSVLSGITLTKLIGMCVLALTRSKLLEIYYFRMWLTLIISGALHGLVFLPVVLSLIGGPGYPQQEADEEWMTNAMRNDYDYAPFLADTDSIHSD